MTEQSVVLARANAAIERLDRRLVQAQRTGDPGFFNETYKLRRQQAQAEGRPFMAYTAARARLQRALVAVAAGDRPGIVARVFGGEGACHRGDQSDVAPKYNMQYPSQALYPAEYRG